jgi:hypothetical protein
VQKRERQFAADFQRSRGCTRKIKYKTKDFALSVSANAGKRAGCRINVYLCKWCGFYHLAHLNHMSVKELKDWFTNKTTSNVFFQSFATTFVVAGPEETTQLINTALWVKERTERGLYAH